MGKFLCAFFMQIYYVISAYSPGIYWLIRIGVSIVADVVFVLTPGRIRSYTEASL